MNIFVNRSHVFPTEVAQESGISLSEEQCEDLIDLPAAPGRTGGFEER